MPDPSLSVVMPVCNENLGVVTALKQAIDAEGWELIVVDDGSTLPVPFATLRHEVSQGYGASLKAGIRRATGDYVATMDGDGQHLPFDVKRLLEYLLYMQRYAMVIGDRRLKERGKRLWGRKGLNGIASLFAHRWIPDLNSGMRIFRRQVALGYEPILSNGFSFTTSLTLSMLADGYEVDWLPIKVYPRHYGQTKVQVWRDGWRTLKLIVYLGLVLRTRKLRQWLRPLTNTVRHAT